MSPEQNSWGQKDARRLKNYVIGRIEALIERYGAAYPRLTRSGGEVEAKEAAFKAFKVSYDREKGYVGFSWGKEFRVDCTHYDRLLLLF